VQAASTPLQVLAHAGLIVRGRTAQPRPSRLRAVPLREATHWLAEYRRFWERGFDRLETRLSDREEPAGD
jgi:hypothetical protein